MRKIDFTKLLGFETVAGANSNLDLQDETVTDKLGARVGTPEETGSLSKGIDFADENIGAKLGAKVGVEETGGGGGGGG
jgi:hypothetical protein